MTSKQKMQTLHLKHPDLQEEKSKTQVNMFGKRFNLLTVYGFQIGLDISWFFIAILLTWTLAFNYFPYQYPNLSQSTYWFMGLFGMLGLFFSVVLHELGHAIVARRFDLPISRITLFIFGGVAEMTDEPPHPKAEFLVAIAGPIVSIFLAISFYFLTQLGIQLHVPVAFTGITFYLAIINAVIVIFNLIPAFPLDGGRVLRSLLWWWKNDLKWAMKIVTILGSGFAFTLIFLGIFSFFTGNFFVGIWWFILGLFLQQAISISRSQFYVKQELHGETVRSFMTLDPIEVSPLLSIKELINEHIFRSYHHLYPVVDQGVLVGYVSLKEIKAIEPEKWEKTKVSDILIPLGKFPTVPPNAKAIDALALFNEYDIPSLLVIEDGSLIGILTTHDLFKAISLKLELEEE